MKKRYIIPAVIVSLILVVFILCYGREDESPTISIQDVNFSFNEDTEYKKGSFFCKQGVIGVSADDLLTYTSLDLKASITLCNQVDCTHGDENCPAWFGLSNVLVVYYYKDKQYVLLEDRTSLFSKPVLYEADADGKNRHKICSFEYYSSMASSYYCIENHMYMFLSDVSESQRMSIDQEGQIVEKPQTMLLLAYDFESGETKEIKVLNQAYQQYFYFEGEYDGKIIYQRQYFTKPYEEIYDKDGECDDTAYDEANMREIGFISLENGNCSADVIQEGPLVTCIGMNQGKIYWHLSDSTLAKSPFQIYVYDINTQTTEEIPLNLEIPVSCITIANQKLFFNHFYEQGMTAYDLQSGEIIVWNEVEQYVTGEYRGYYLLSGDPAYNYYSDVVPFDLLGDESEYIFLGYY
ncbi:MAG: hypothetical protein ACI39R_06605 [Lachnospiraceae bacterium]